MKSLTLTALDIGTSSIKGLCAEKNFKTGEIDILGKVQEPCFGVRNGEVVKPEQVAKSILQVKQELIEKSGFKIKEVLVNIGGSHLFSVPSQGVVSVSRADQKISKEDVQRVLRAAETVNLPSNKEILEVYPQEFIIDGEGGIKEPLGLEGIRLEVKVLLACLFSPILENLERAVAEAGWQILEVIPSPLATARAVLKLEQKELGVCLVNIGAGTTAVSVFEKGDLIDFAIFPLGSANITNDVAIGLRTEIQTAEQLKLEFSTLQAKNKKKGAVSSRDKGKKKEATIKTVAFSVSRDKIEIPEKSLTFSRKFLKNIVEARVSEIFFEVQKTLKKITGGEPLPGGLVLTGGGAKLPGIVEFAKQKLKLPCRLGTVEEVNTLGDAQFSTCAGLLLTGFDFVSQGRERQRTTLDKGGFGAKLKRVLRAFKP